LTTSAAVEHKGNNIQLMAVRILETHNITTRKSAKTNGNTDGNIPLGIFADGYNSVSKFVGIYRLYRR
jgi:hypothetical protein